ncbi:MAG: biotin transporter BioY [Propionibacteriaceae bacterium]|jgi:biotin transport system substrate-specific component|nr:biotin transporter BioY [Propionibacteriaceae bacterium]
MSRSRSPVHDVALVAVFAALIAALALAPAVPIGVGVPITLQTLGVALAGAVLGPWRGGLACLLYQAVGFAGLPVFAGGAAGLGVLAQPSAGYLLAFPLAAVVVGGSARVVLKRSRRWRPAKLTLAALTGSILVIHPAGVVGIALNAHLAWPQAMLADLVYWPGDLIKSSLVGFVAAAVHRAFPALLSLVPVRPAPQLALD